VPRHLHLAGTGTVGAAVQRWQQRSPTSSGAAVQEPRKQIWVGVVVCVSVLVYCGGQARAGRLVRIGTHAYHTTVVVRGSDCSFASSIQHLNYVFVCFIFS
jgi:hypothetical protein